MTGVETDPISPALVPAPTGPLVVEGLPAGAGTGVRLSLIIPTYNEGKNLAEMVAAPHEDPRERGSVATTS